MADTTSEQYLTLGAWKLRAIEKYGEDSRAAAYFDPLLNLDPDTMYGEPVCKPEAEVWALLDEAEQGK